MNKLLIIMILLLSSCSIDISESLFIASIGFEILDEEINGYFYIPLSSDVGKTEKEGKGSGEFVRVAGQNIEQVFNNVDAVNSININLKHVSSVVLNQELYNDDFISDFIDYVKYSNRMDFNFYFFTTNEKMEDIYSFKNPNQESVLNSLLVISGDNAGIRLVADPVHYLEFCKKFFSKRSILIPRLDIEELWNIDGENAKNFYPQSAIYFYQGVIKEVVKEKGSPFLKNNINFYDEIEKEPIYFCKYKMALSREGIINIELKYESFNSKNITNKKVIQLVQTRIQEYIKRYQDYDPLDFYFYNDMFNKKFSYNELKFNINIIVN